MPLTIKCVRESSMKLYSYFRSSAAYRVRIALNVKAIDYDTAFINLKQGEQCTPEWLAVNPEGLVPVLEVSTTEKLTQSVAILEWIEETYPQPALLPDSGYERAQVRSMVGQIACDMHPLNNLRILKYLTSDLHITEENKLNWYRHWINIGFTAFEKKLAGGLFCFGEQITLADVCLIPQVYNAIRFNVDLTPYPFIEKVYQHCMSLAVFIDASPEQQPDAIL